MQYLRSASLLLVSGCFSTLAFAAATPKSVQGNILRCEGGSGCTDEAIDGRVYKVMRTPRMEVKVSVSIEGNYTRADVSIVNNSAAHLDVLPASFRVDVLTPKPRILEYIEPASLTLPMRAGFQTKRNARRRTAAALVAPKPQPDLTPGEVLPAGVIEGKVFFERDRKARIFNVVLPISGAVFEFPYQLR